MDNNLLEKIVIEATGWRKLLHQHPQTSYEEVFARDLIASELNKMGIKTEVGIAKTGVVGVLEGKSPSAKKIGLRADIDALNITEENSFEHKSKFSGKMHACGHDGHTAMLLGAAKYLAQTKNFKGTAYFIFQPAEEGGAGAQKMMDEGLFNKFPMDTVWGLHNMPGLEVGHIKFREGTMMASTDEFIVNINGSGGHAAWPQLTIDPIVVASHIVVALQSIVARNISPTSSGVISVTMINGGSAFNIIPDQVTIRGTIRSLDDNVRNQLVTRAQEIVKHISASFGAKAELELVPISYPVLVNSTEETHQAASIAKQAVENVSRLEEPTLGGEDFAFMLQHKPGSYVMLGNGVEGKGAAALHTSRYDFNDQAAIYGIKYWISLVENILQA